MFAAKEKIDKFYLFWLMKRTRKKVKWGIKPPTYPSRHSFEMFAQKFPQFRNGWDGKFLNCLNLKSALPKSLGR
jgi:hypothetical protein